MFLSVNWLKEYVELPNDLSMQKLAYDLTMRTVEVEQVIDFGKKFDNICVGVITTIKQHPNADRLYVCMVDVAQDEDLQIVCGGSNLEEGMKVVVSKIGAQVVWHGEGEPVKIKKTKMRGVESYGMICASEEVYLKDMFPAKDETEVVDLSNIDCTAGDPLAQVLGFDDYILEIDNKSMTNRPDLWGHYGIARELSAIYKTPLQPLPKLQIDPKLPEFSVHIHDPDACMRYAGVVIENVKTEPTPTWMQSALLRVGQRPINKIVDITNYVLFAVGQPTHAFDRTHVKGGIEVRHAKANEKLVLLDDKELELSKDDLVIADHESVLALAGVKGGKKDSILPTTTSIVLEVATFAAGSIRKTSQRYDTRTEASNRYEKALDTAKVDDGIALALKLFSQLYPDSTITAIKDEHPTPTICTHISIDKSYLNTRLGRQLSYQDIVHSMGGLGFTITENADSYHCITPVWRSTGDVSVPADILEEIARLYGYENFERMPLTGNIEKAIKQPKMLLERNIREYLAHRCNFTEIFTYPWVSDHYIKASGVDTQTAVRLATPPSAELAHLRTSLVPGLLEAVQKNRRYFETFRIFEAGQVYEQGHMHPSIPEETLPVQTNSVAACIVGKNAEVHFFELKGVLESMARYCHMKNISLEKHERAKPAWADEKVYLNIILDTKIIGSISLVSAKAMKNADIKHTAVALFECNRDALIPCQSRENKFAHLPLYPLVEQDLSLVVNEDISWQTIQELICKKVNHVEFIEEYRGKQIEKGKKSIVLRVRFGSNKGTLTSKHISKKMDTIITTLAKKCGAELRD
ncbi:MAG TPA: phenylalanine--tRNA ligase subunit beta [Treponemataceae bacterium]|nr:phenylalanine--tRNA ligase subunit beta [Treponemataceae bacterium]